MKNLFCRRWLSVLSVLWVLSVLLGAMSLGTAQAQTTYKCGNSYSQTPCDAGKVIDTQDQRTAAQKEQADQSTRNSEKAAQNLAAERNLRERREEAQIRREKAAEKAEAAKKKVHRTPLKPHVGKKLKPEKAANPAKPSKPAKAAKP